MTRRSVAIIGAGPSGLVAGKVLVEDGFDVTIFDRQKTLGGIWSPDGAYANLCSQQLAGFMEFSDLPDLEAKENAPWQDIHRYLKRFAEKFDLVKRIRFQSTVTSIDKNNLRDPTLPWTVKIETADQQHQTLQFHLVVVANGLFSTPFQPHFLGQNKFAGPIVHANNIKTHEQLMDKRVVVIGGGKAAIDFASLAGKYALSCHLVIRRPHWFVPESPFSDRLPAKYAYSRFMTAILYPFPYAPHTPLFYFFRWLFSSVLRNILKTISNQMVSTLKSDVYQDEKFIPKSSFHTSENSVRMTKEFAQLIRDGRIVRKLASIDEIIDSTTIHLSSNEFLQADMIICATGYLENFPFLSRTFHRALGQDNTDESVDLDLYRRIVPVGIPNIAFIGLPASLNTWMFFEVQSHWTSDYFLGRIRLPETEKEMFEEIQTTRNFIRRLFNRKSYYFQYYWLEPIEIYLQDMGVSLHRTSNWISEYFGAYRPKRLANLHEERRYRYRHWYWSFTRTIFVLILFLILVCFFITSYRGYQS
ncbi:unnamed protein product [Adineta ricciae]|uniref:Flavin-containing monooxygenase n=1 Tax=Adineta ricciae TaxID=249248 RepID=A0A813SU98_ADIRI|nr:unnamed protein product [Adineta ricciae]CAF1386354.1 unnamed protein product [Adineta ricciae]